MTDPRKIGFRLERDEDGYPPPGSEWLWAYPSEGMWVIDNIPWYSREVSLGDAVETASLGRGALSAPLPGLAQAVPSAEQSFSTTA